MNEKIPGKGLAIASLVLGIIALVCCFVGEGAIVSVVLGIVGIVLASKSKKEGFTSGVRTAGFVCSLIGLVIGGVMFVLAFALLGSIMVAFA